MLDSNKVNHFTNGKCSVIIHDDYYEIQSEDEFGHIQYFTKDLIIYHLIGYLTYYGLMDKDYK